MYHLTLTKEDWSTIYFVGYRYFWSHALIENLSVNSEMQEYDIPEHIAWLLRDAFDMDTEGNHSLFPMLAPQSELYEKLLIFWSEIV